MDDARVSKRFKDIGCGSNLCSESQTPLRLICKPHSVRCSVELVSDTTARGYFAATAKLTEQLIWLESARIPARCASDLGPRLLLKREFDLDLEPF